MKNIYFKNKSIFEYFINFENSNLKTFNKDYLKKNNLLDYYNMINSNSTIYYKKIKDLKIILEIFNGIEKKLGIPYFTIKSFLNYPFIDDDIDFVIYGDGFYSYVKELKKFGFKHKYNLADYREPNKKIYIHTDYSIKVHLHKKLSWNGIKICNKKEIFEYCKYNNIDGKNFRIPSDTDELLIAIAHFLFENYYFKIGEIIYLKYLLNQNININRIYKISEKYGYRKGVNLFFNYLNSISNKYDLNIEFHSIELTHNKIKKNKLFPFFIPYYKLFPTYLENFIDGIRRKEFLNLFRKLFTYTIVGYLWKYIIPQKRLKKFL